MYNVIIMGAGLAGLMAAAAAVKKKKKVLVIAKGRGNLYSASGYIDFLGYYPTSAPGPLTATKAALKELTTKAPGHPYAILGEERIEEAFSFFKNFVAHAGYPYVGDWAENRIHPTAAGALAPTALVPAGNQAELKAFKDILVVGFRELIDFFPFYAAANLQAQFYRQGLEKNVRGIWLDLALGKGRELNSYDLAVALEEEKVRDRLIEQLRVKVSEDTLVLVPAVLGVKKWDLVKKDLEGKIKTTFLEIPTLPPSVLGMRLAEALMAHLEKLGVDFHFGHPVTGIRHSEGVCHAVEVQTASGRTMREEAQAFVLATGGILGGGIKVYPNHIAEEICGIQVEMPDNNSKNDFFAAEGQPLSYAGIKVNQKLQPLSEKGEALYKNLFVAGRNLAGYDPFVEKSGNGVALTSGYWAGQLAAEGRD